MTHLAHLSSTTGTGARLYSISEKNASYLQEFGKGFHHAVLTIMYQGREHWIIIIPTPPLAIEVGILHGTVSKQRTVNGVYALSLNAVSYLVQFLRPYQRIHTPYKVVVTGVCLHQSCSKLIFGSQSVECRDSRKEFHGRGWSQGLQSIPLIHYRVGIEVIDHQAHLRCAQYLSLTDHTIEPQHKTIHLLSNNIAQESEKQEI